MLIFKNIIMILPSRLQTILMKPTEKGMHRFSGVRERDSFRKLIEEQGTKGSYLGDYGDENFTNAQLYTALQEKQRASEYGIYNLNLQTSAGNNVSMNLGNLITPFELCIPSLLKIKSSGSDSLQ